VLTLSLTTRTTPKLSEFVFGLQAAEIAMGEEKKAPHTKTFSPKLFPGYD
jgi:hypothetical protein